MARTPPPKWPISHRPAARGSTGKPRPLAVGTAPRCIHSSNKSAGEVLVVLKLDRLSRSLRLNLLEKLASTQTGFRSLPEAINTTTTAGQMVEQRVGALAEFERAMLQERTRTGLENARRCRPFVPYPPGHCFPSAGAPGGERSSCRKGDRQNCSGE